MSTNAADTTIEIHSCQPSRLRITSASANRFTPAMSTCAIAKISAFRKCVGALNRLRRYSGTLCTPVS